MILIGLLGKCFFEQLESEKFPSPVISFFKKELSNIKQICFYYNVNEVNLTNYPLRDFKNIYSEMSNLLNEYGKLNKRNKKKDKIHLVKHFMHLIRLKLMLKYILIGKGIVTYMENDIKLLLDIRNNTNFIRRENQNRDRTKIWCSRRYYWKNS